MSPLSTLALALLALPLLVLVAVPGRRALLAALPVLVTLSGLTLPVGGFNLRADQVASLLLCASLALAMAMRQRRLYVDAPMRWLAAFAAVSVLSSVLFSPDRAYSLTQVANLAVVWALYVVVVNFADEPAAASTLQRRLAYGGLAATTIGVLAFLVAKAGLDLGGANVTEYVGEVSQPIGSFGTMHEPNIFGSYSAAMLVLAAGALLAPSDRGANGPWLARALAATSAVALIFSFTRGAWLGAATGLAVLLLLARRHLGVRVRMRTILAPVGVLLVLAVVLWFSPFAMAEFFRYKITNLFNVQSQNAVIRLVTFGLAIEHVTQRPLLGWGTFSFAAVLGGGTEIRQVENWKNLWIPNFVLQVLHDTGVVGLAVFLGLLGSIIRRGLRAARVAAAESRADAGNLVALVAAYCTLFVPFLFTTGFSLGYAWLLPALVGAHARRVLAPHSLRATSAAPSPRRAGYSSIGNAAPDVGR